MSDPPIFRPLPRRAFEITPASTPTDSSPSTPNPENTNPELLEAKLAGSSPPARTRSILNLTSSTLFGIYSPTGYDVSRDEPSTPWGTGAQTPSHRGSVDNSRPPENLRWEKDTASARKQSHIRHHSSGSTVLHHFLRTLLLFMFGVAYGIIVTHLHDNQNLAPVKVKGINQHSWLYLAFWGMAGVVLGSLLPWVDVWWEDVVGTGEQARKDSLKKRRASGSGATRSDSEERFILGSDSGLGTDWNPAVRSIGAFVGIAFAIRKLPWQSTLQEALTLALANPVLWYLIDRSKPGFILSSIIGIAGTLVLLGVNPEVVPPPTKQGPTTGAGLEDLGISSGVLTSETVGVGTWIASVLFCSCVCFGNVGRRLAS